MRLIFLPHNFLACNAWKSGIATEGTKIMGKKIQRLRVHPLIGCRSRAMRLAAEHLRKVTHGASSGNALTVIVKLQSSDLYLPIWKITPQLRIDSRRDQQQPDAHGNRNSTHLLREGIQQVHGTRCSRARCSACWSALPERISRLLQPATRLRFASRPRTSGATRLECGRLEFSNSSA
jgi:hypothetical protein